MPSLALRRARSLYDRISAQAGEAERIGRITDDAASALLESGLFNQLLPVSAGGLGATRAEYFEVIEHLSKADGSAGWCLSVCSVANLLIHQALPPDGLQQMREAGEVLAWLSLIPSAKATPADGGFRVSGAFGWGSGSSFSDWVIVAEPLPDRDGRQWFRSYVVPKNDVDLDTGSWNPMGLKATASVNYRITDVFIPTERSFEYPLEQAITPGTVSTQSSGLLNRIGLTAFASGVGLRALSELETRAQDIRRTGTLGSQADDEIVQHGIGLHHGILAATRARFLGLVAEQDQFVANHGVPSTELARSSATSAMLLARASRDAAVFAYDGAGTKVVLSGDPIQRCVRDLFTGLKHATFSESHFSRDGKVRLGLTVPALPRFGAS